MPRRRPFKISLAAFVVLTGVWIASGWVAVGYSTDTWWVGTAGGTIFGAGNFRSGVGFYCEVRPWKMYVLPQVEWPPGTLYLMIPLWFPAFLACIATIVLWRPSRHVPPGHCKACRYDLTGNTSGTCPECGTRVEP